VDRRTARKKPLPSITRDPLATHNDRVKLLASFLNAIGLGLLGFAVLRPVTETPINVTWLSAWWGGCGVAFHGLSLYILKYLRKEVGI
jgi:hypothetical protein